MEMRRIPLNCSKCGRFVGADGFQDYDADSREVGYPLCKRCLDARPRTIYDIFMAAKFGEAVTEAEEDRLDKHVKKYGALLW